MAASYVSALNAAREAAAGQNHAPGCLYVVATPIGNLADISLRALYVLGLVDRIACEDTRHTQKLLRTYGLEKPLMAIHEHNERAAAEQVIGHLRLGERMAYVSDAGTPGVSDPGARLVAVVSAADLQVVPIPGASSVTAALSVAGALGDGGFVFVGFLPQRGQARSDAWRRIEAESRSVVVLEAPHRVREMGADIARLGERRITIAREITKQHEQIATMAARDVPTWLGAAETHQRGEFVWVIHPADASAQAADVPQEADRVLGLLLDALPLKTAVRLAADITGGARNTLYERALVIRSALAHPSDADEGSD